MDPHLLFIEIKFRMFKKLLEMLKYLASRFEANTGKPVLCCIGNIVCLVCLSIRVVIFIPFSRLLLAQRLI